MRLLLVALALAPSLAAAGEPGVSLAGSGLLTLPSVATLPPGRVRLGLALDNRDRDPLGLDLLDGALVFSVGVRPGLEAYGRVVASRVVSLPEPPTLPPPPLDLIVAPGAEAPLRAYHALYAPVPYVNKRGSARFSAFVPGDALLGAKARLFEGRGLVPGVALSAELTLPLTRRLSNLESGAGTGGVDIGARVTAGWSAGRTSLVASLGFTRVGRPAFGERLIFPGSVRDVALDLPDRLELGLGARRPLSPRLALLAEATGVLDVGGGTPLLDAAAPVDGLAGVQLRLGAAHLTAGLRYHGNSLPSGALRPVPLAGLVDVTDVDAAELALYLAAVGAEASTAHLRSGSQRLLVPPPFAPPPPPGARVIPASYRIRSEHQVGFTLILGWAF